MSEYRYQLERYRGRSTRYVCPQCKRKQSFTRYIDTYNNNEYVSDNVGKCNRIDKCGYHYTPKQYYTDNPWKRENSSSGGWLVGRNARVFDQPTKTKPPQPPAVPSTSYIPEWVAAGSLKRDSTHMQWLRTTFGNDEAERIRQLYGVGGTRDGRVVFWQRDTQGLLRTGKIMAYDPVTGRRTKGAGSCDWAHSIMLREGRIAQPYNLKQCLYGEHLLGHEAYATATVAIVESYKTAHVGAIVLPEMLWTATDSLQGLTAERLMPLRGRRVVLYPDEGRGEEIWREKILSIAHEVGFDYTISNAISLYDSANICSSAGRDIADLVEVAVTEQEAPF